jgi:hypothetical protein
MHVVSILGPITGLTALIISFKIHGYFIAVRSIGTRQFYMEKACGRDSVQHVS